MLHLSFGARRYRADHAAGSGGVGGIVYTVHDQWQTVQTRHIAAATSTARGPTASGRASLLLVACGGRMKHVINIDQDEYRTLQICILKIQVYTYGTYFFSKS